MIIDILFSSYLDILYGLQTQKSMLIRLCEGVSHKKTIIGIVYK